MVVKQSEISAIKMSVNPPQCVVDADFCVIAHLEVMKYVGIGWVPLRTATQRDYDTIPHIIEPHCSHCCHYEILPNETMYCSKWKNRSRLGQCAGADWDTFDAAKLMIFSETVAF